MKIKTLHIYNIASIEDETLDFTQSPLCDSDVFLITGKTGSGKTTILDAICLALYRTTPRLAQSSTSKVETNSDNLTLNDPRNLMRRNTGEAFVNLTFDGVDGHEYEVEWHVQRGQKKKVTVSLDPATWTLRDLTADKVYVARGEKDKEVKAAMLQAVGLEFNQFCRTTMLAQGEFTKFLKSAEKEKVEILEKITRFTEYTEIGKRVFLITSLKRKAWDAAREKAQDNGMSEEEIAKLKEEIELLDTHVKGMVDERNVLLLKKQWLKDETDIQKEKVEAVAGRDVVKAVFDSDEFKAKVKTIDEWNETSEQRNKLKQMNDAKDTMRELERQQAILAGVHEQLLGGVAHEERVKQDNDAAINELKNYFAARESRKEVIEHAQAIMILLGNVANYRTKVNDKRDEIETLKNNLSGKYTPAFEHAKNQMNEAWEKSDKLNDEIKGMQGKLDRMEMKRLQEEHQAANTMVLNIDVAKRSLLQLENARNSFAEKEKALGEAAQKLEEARHECAALDAPLAQAQGEMKAFKTALDNQKESVDKWAKRTRATLHKGSVCPVCQQKIEHDIPHEDILDKLYADAKRAYDDADERLVALQQRRFKLEADVKAKEDALKRDTEALRNDTSVSQAEAQALNDCRKCGFDEITPDIVSKLEQSRNVQQQKLKDLKKTILQGEEIENAVRLKRNELITLESKIKSELQQSFDASKEAKETCEANIKAATEAINAYQGEIGQATGGITPFIPIEDWKSDPSGYAAQLNDEVRDYTSKRERLALLENQQQLLGETLRNAKAACRQITDVQPQWAGHVASGVQAVPTLVQDLNTLVGNVKTCKAQLADKIKEFDQAKASVDEFLTSRPDMSIERLLELNGLSSGKIVSLQDECNGVLDLLHAKEAMLQNVEERIVKHNNDEVKMLITAEDSVEGIDASTTQLDGELNTCNQTLGVKRNMLREDIEKKSQHASLENLEKTAKADYDRWNRVNSIIGDKDGTKFQKIAQSYILGSLLNSANVYLRQLAPRYTLKEVPGTLHISLEDAYQGFATRGSDSLSGGESFLVSLALALALADIGQGLSVDTLFIDEGFGTLSGQPLTNAINTLRSLHHHSGRHVGVISHVDEVKANIPVQIQIIQEGNSSSSKINLVG